MSLAISKLLWLPSGSCVQASHFLCGDWGLKKTQMPCYFGVYRHPKRGIILFDTGYSEHYLKATECWPEKIYRLMAPVHVVGGAKTVLENYGIDPEQVRYVVISHFHGDHIGGLKDFPRAKFIVSAEAWRSVGYVSRLSGFLKGFFRELLPHNFSLRVRLVEDEWFRPFTLGGTVFPRAFDLFGDRTVWMIDLPGHAPGQMGALVRSCEGGFDFLVADAIWHPANLIDAAPPSRITGFLVHHDWKLYMKTMSFLRDIHLRENDLRIRACHCGFNLSSGAESQMIRTGTD